MPKTNAIAVSFLWIAIGVMGTVAVLHDMPVVAIVVTGFGTWASWGLNGLSN